MSSNKDISKIIKNHNDLANVSRELCKIMSDKNKIMQEGILDYKECETAIRANNSSANQRSIFPEQKSNLPPSSNTFELRKYHGSF